MPEGTLRFHEWVEPERLFSCPHCGKALPRHRRRESWVEVRHDGWVASYRIVLKGRSPVVGEVRLFPDEPKRPAGRWSGEAKAVLGAGLPGRLLREFRLGDPMALYPEIVKNWDRRHGAQARRGVFSRHGLGRGGRVVARKPGRAGRPDTYYAIWSEAYVERIRAGSRTPVKDLALDPPVRIQGYVSDTNKASPATIRDILTEARHRGILTSSPSGRAGGELTTRGKKLLKKKDKAHQPPA
jgi:hypothetical protein